MHGLGGVHRISLDGQDHALEVAENLQTALVDAHRRGIAQLGGFQVARTLERDPRRHAGVSGLAPIGMRARLELDFDARAVGDVRSGLRPPCGKQTRLRVHAHAPWALGDRICGPRPGDPRGQNRNHRGAAERAARMGRFRRRARVMERFCFRAG